MASHPDPTRLIALLSDAEAEADRLGPAGVAARHHLEQASAEARSLQVHGGRPEEGVAVGDLTTGNDQ